jgi:hypothetical protein
MYGKIAGIFAVALSEQAPRIALGSPAAGGFLLGLAGIFGAIQASVVEINKLDDQDEANADH